MQVRCIKPFGRAVVGDVVEVPDGALVDPDHWEPLEVTVGAARADEAVASAKAELGELAARLAAPAKEDM